MIDERTLAKRLKLNRKQFTLLTQSPGFPQPARLRDGVASYDETAVDTWLAARERERETASAEAANRFLLGGSQS